MNTVLVTGATAGLGRNLVTHLYLLGWSVHAHGRPNSTPTRHTTSRRYAKAQRKIAKAVGFGKVYGG